MNVARIISDPERLIRVKVVIVCLLITLLAGASGAQDGEKVISLKEAVVTALKENHELLASGFELDSAGEDVGIARSALLPHLSFEERFMRTNNPPSVFSAKLNQQRFAQHDFSIDLLNGPQAINDYQTSVALEQVLFSGRAIVGLDMTRLQREARAEELARKKQEIAYRVVAAFLSVQTARQYVTAAERGVEDATEHRRVAQLRYDSGLGLYSDVLRAATALAEAEQRLVSSQAGLNLSKRSLGLLLGQAGPLDASADTPEFSQRGIDVYAGMASSRGDVKAAELYLDNARNGIKLADAGYLPTLGMGGSYQMNDHRRPLGSEGESWTVQAFLRWEIFDGLKREHERAKAKYRVSQAQEQLAAIKTAVSFKVYEAYLGVEEAAKNAELSGAALKAAEEGKRLVEMRYRNSLAPLVDLMDAQSNLDRARAAFIARTNDSRLARANLSYQGGALIDDLAIEK
ncbi:MAG TPA: TolC family protein [Dissulfurispiraceae bacterium]|nr:TolC family protein [Dissulfurispiraceae bacterium]